MVINKECNIFKYHRSKLNQASTHGYPVSFKSQKILCHPESCG